jgi:RNA polymerase sigma factor (sigma-70 family)
MGARFKLQPIRDYELATLRWLDEQPGPVSTGEVCAALGLGAFVDLDALHQSGRAFEDHEGWQSTGMWCHRNERMVHKVAQKVRRWFPRYDYDDIAGVAVEVAYGLARSVRPVAPGGKPCKFLTWFHNYAPSHVRAILGRYADGIALPHHLRGAAPSVTHFGALVDDGARDATGMFEPVVESSAEERVFGALAWELADKLPPRQRLALHLLMRCYYTLEDAGEVMGLTRERVRQIRNAALESLRKKLPEPEGGWLPLDHARTYSRRRRRRLGVAV